MLSTVQIDRDTKIKKVGHKVAVFQKPNTALKEEFLDIKETTEHLFSIFRNEVSYWKTKIKSPKKKTHTTDIDSLWVKIDSNEQYELCNTLILSGPLAPEASDRENFKK